VAESSVDIRLIGEALSNSWEADAKIFEQLIRVLDLDIHTTIPVPRRPVIGRWMYSVRLFFSIRIPLNESIRFRHAIGGKNVVSPSSISMNINKQVKTLASSEAGYQVDSITVLMNDIFPL
jgi:hypothetical protein